MPADLPEHSEDVAVWVSRRDEAAARRLMEALHPRVAGIISRHWARQDEWEDLEQEVFMRVFEALPRFRQEGVPLEHWVSRIALNLCRRRWRSRSRKPELRWSDLGEGEQQAFLQAQHPDDQPLSPLGGRSLGEAPRSPNRSLAPSGGRSAAKTPHARQPGKANSLAPA